jgi:hypothetical protein
MVTALGLLSGANASALRVSPFSPVGFGFGFGFGFGAGAGASLAGAAEVGAAEVGDGRRTVVAVDGTARDVRAAVVVGVLGLGVTEEAGVVVAELCTVRPADAPPAHAVRNRATRASQSECRMVTWAPGRPARP